MGMTVFVSDYIAISL